MVLDYRTVSTVHAILYYNVSTATVQSIYTTVVQHMLLLTSMTCYIIFDVAYSLTHLIYAQALLFLLYLAYLHHPLCSPYHIHSINSFPFHPFFTFYSTPSYPILSCPILYTYLITFFSLSLYFSILPFRTVGSSFRTKDLPTELWFTFKSPWSCPFHIPYDFGWAEAHFPSR